MEEENSLTKNAASEIENNSLSHTTEHTQISSLVIKDSILKIAIANACLLIWAILLAVIGMQAVSGKASTVILDIAEAFVPSKKALVKQRSDKQTPKSADDKKEAQQTPKSADDKKEALCKDKPTSEQDETSLKQDEVSFLMSYYIEKTYPGQDATSIPPIAIVLDRFQVNVNWRDASALKKVNGNENPPGCNDYENLFYIVAKRLEAIADFSPEVSVGSNLKVSNNIMPLKFRAMKPTISEFKEQEIELPLEAVLWVKARQASTTARKSQINFLDLFILLIILGGFGSWIYLVRRHIDPLIKVDLYEYFYRPPLGMTLAIAVFIVNITLHSFVSTSNINEVRRETLILLAFTAGLLTDKTYEFIEKATGEKLGHKKLEDELKRESK
jgi:hypothetical protein